jgi:hypothetical protein
MSCLQSQHTVLLTALQISNSIKHCPLAQLANFNTIDAVHNLSTAQLEELNSIDIILYLKKESLTHYSADAKLSTSINLISGTDTHYEAPARFASQRLDSSNQAHANSQRPSGQITWTWNFLLHLRAFFVNLCKITGFHIKYHLSAFQADESL